MNPALPAVTATALANQAKNETGCCPRFDPKPWQDRELSWHDKPFVKEHVRCFFHVPLHLEQVFAKEQALIEAAGARADDVVLSDETSRWGADYYFAVSKDIPGADMTTLSGSYLTKVFNGPYQNVRTWIGDMRAYAASLGKSIEHMYFWYTTCPKCAKYYGENYVVLFAKTR